MSCGYYSSTGLNLRTCPVVSSLFLSRYSHCYLFNYKLTLSNSVDSKKSKSPPDVPLSAPQPMVEAAAPSRALVQKPVAPLRALVDEDEIEDELEGWMSSLC
ncbi:hypothetical protein FXO37_04966 [Capsicum annuum]|nr:hypothetical protein FXO37_04966 [Capsicum annuum]